jgi:serine/threonine-protein kinase
LLFVAVIGCISYAVYAPIFAAVAFEPVTMSLYVLLVGQTGTLAGLLRSSRPLSLPRLRRIEVILFAGAALLFTRMLFQFYYWEWLSRVRDDDWLALMTLSRGMSFGWFVLIVGYGLFIPNTWRRCAAVVGALAVWPVLLNAALALPDRPLETRLTFVAQSALDVGLAVALAIYGAHRIETLREQAAQARKLGQYQLKRRLGAGGMGEVWLAEHVLLRRPCAMKLIRPERAGDPQFVRRFEREVRATAALSHPNTVEVFDYGQTDDGAFYYAMEYLTGLTLQELVERHGPLPPERAVHLLRQVCGALQEAHGVGLVHRDVKPGNVLACRRGGLCDVAKLLDFGLVRARGLGEPGQSLTQEGMIAGTPAYLSPEQAAGKADLDGRSDLYSLGALAYFLLTGRPPFVRDTAVRTMAAHLDEAVVAPDRHRPDLPADLQAVVLRCLEKDPARRDQSADDLEAALAGCGCAGGWTRERAAAWWRDNVTDPVPTA